MSHRGTEETQRAAARAIERDARRYRNPPPPASPLAHCISVARCASSAPLWRTVFPYFLRLATASSIFFWMLASAASIVTLPVVTGSIWLSKVVLTSLP